MKPCPECRKQMEKVDVTIEGAETKATSYQCTHCNHYEFEQTSAKQVLEELKEKESPLRLQQKLVKLSRDRLGIYLNKDIIRSLHLKAGKTIHISVPEEKTILVRLV